MMNERVRTRRRERAGTGKIMRFSRENRARMPRTRREGNSCRDEGEEDLRERSYGERMRVSRNGLLSPLTPLRAICQTGEYTSRDNTPKFRRRSGRYRGLAVDKCAAVTVPFSGNARFACGYKWRSRHTGMPYDKRAIRERDDAALSKKRDFNELICIFIANTISFQLSREYLRHLSC